MAIEPATPAAITARAIPTANAVETQSADDHLFFAGLIEAVGYQASLSAASGLASLGGEPVIFSWASRQRWSTSISIRLEMVFAGNSKTRQ